MINCIQIQWTCGSFEEAKKVAHILIKKKLVACVNILPDVESIYYWREKIEEDQEVKVLLKTQENRFEKVKNIIEANTDYEVPAIIAVPIIHGNEKYLDWIMESVD